MAYIYIYIYIHIILIIVLKKHLLRLIEKNSLNKCLFSTIIKKEYEQETSCYTVHTRCQTGTLCGFTKASESQLANDGTDSSAEENISPGKSGASTVMHEAVVAQLHAQDERLFSGPAVSLQQ